MAADELDRLLAYDDATATAALTRLLHDWTGCAIPQTSDLPESEVEELVPLCVSILRRHWQTPLTCLGDGITPMSLADLLRQLIDGRVNGNEALGIPPANANIPAALTALRERHIADGLTPELPDGISLAQLLCTTLADTITELKDDNVGWTMSKPMDWTKFPNLTKVTLGVKEAPSGTLRIINNLQYVEELHLPFLKRAYSYGNKGGDGWGFIEKLPLLKSLYLPEFVEYSANSHSSTWEGFIEGCDALEEFIAPKLSTIHAVVFYNYNSMLSRCPNLKKIVVGTITSIKTYSQYEGSDAFTNTECPNLIHFEIGEGTAVSLRLSNWNPTTALAERLDEFLSNFKQFIAHRLTDKGSGLTLTLSPAVRDAIQTDPSIVSIITSKGWTISPAPSV